MRIVRVLETHNHADHVSGHGRFALEHGVPVSIHRLAEAEYPRDVRGRRRADGRLAADQGDVHAGPPARALLLPRRGPSADRRLVADRRCRAARPGGRCAEGAEALFASLRRLTELPDDVEVDPGHTGGSLCGAGLSRDKVSTVGSERLTNHALAIGDLQEFVAHSAAISAPRPPTVERVVALNRGPFLAAQPPLEQLDAPQGQLLDVRPAEAHAEATRPEP